VDAKSATRAGGADRWRPSLEADGADRPARRSRPEIEQLDHVASQAVERERQRVEAPEALENRRTAM
jgi:hypothetical protein